MSVSIVTCRISRLVMSYEGTICHGDLLSKRGEYYEEHPPGGKSHGDVVKIQKGSSKKRGYLYKEKRDGINS